MKPIEVWIPDCVEDYEWTDSEDIELPVTIVIKKSAYMASQDELTSIKEKYDKAVEALKRWHKQINIKSDSNISITNFRTLNDDMIKTLKELGEL